MMMYSLSNDNCSSTSTFINYSSLSSQGFPHKTFPTNDTCFSFFHPPSPLIVSFEDEALLFPCLQNLETHQPHFSIEDLVSTQENMDDDFSKRSDGNGKILASNKCPEKKCFKKDRHSKIITSKGPRDRRMRLSLEVAPRFFNLQEMLGFDKASQTLEWLMNKSKWAIMELSKNTSTTTCVDTNGALVISSTTSECEVISSSSNVVQDSEGFENLEGKNKSSSSSCTKKWKKNGKTSLFGY
ncbi:hypothetical protein Leryth_011487 [Lithospermum erythrorhizon]|nr:hypothetical protein Leryth_011487 [Lithospermum erythrorhizon]